MIELRTGIPGSGKTLSLVEALSKLLVSWEKKPEDGRPIFVHNIANLALPHSVMPTKEVQQGNKQRVVPDWDLMPDGSLVIIDECQDMLPPRSSQSDSPPHIAWFNTHRHKGFDIWLVTQHPKLIDFSVRALVGKHVHFRRLFGGQRAATYEWDACSDNLSGMKDSVMSMYAFPKKAFQWYKSAEIHTKQSFKLPRWLLIPVIGVVIGVFTFPSAYSTLKNGISGKPLAAPVAVKSPELKPVLAMPFSPIASPGQNIVAPVVMETEPIFPITNLLKVSAKYKPSGCVSSATKCVCFGAAAEVIDVELSECRLASVEIALLVDRSVSRPTSERVLPVKNDRAVLAAQSENDGLHLPLRPVADAYDQRFSTGPSGAIYAQ